MLRYELSSVDFDSDFRVKLIRDAKKTHLPPLRFEYVSEPIPYVINNGHTIRVNSGTLQLGP